MELLIKVFNFVIITVLIVSGQKNDDENRAYEFGFTIDGQQHRHEKKDVNGIIQGEFGFITADGIYHVTVYATDENGNFRILSMRNVRISAPLDGSPLPPGAKIEGSPVGQPQIQKQSPAPPQQTIPTTAKPSRSTFSFTTQPTIKPACAGCGYVTTPKPKPGERFPFQTPAFKPNPGPQSQNPGPQDTNTNFPPYPTAPNPGNPTSNSGLSPNPGLSGLSGNPNPGLSGSPKPSLSGSPNADISGSPNPGINDSPNPGIIGNANPGISGSLNPGISGSPNPNLGPGLGVNPNPDPNSPNLDSKVTVSDNNIHIPGNPDIPIRDKYPGMVDGLPNGVTQKDVTDLLYKFNYTVGFHGHYETGYKNGAKVGGYFVNGRDGISRIVTYVADENGYRPKVKFIRLDLNSDEVPKEGTEKTFGLKNFEFVWYPVN